MSTLFFFFFFLSVFNRSGIFMLHCSPTEPGAGFHNVHFSSLRNEPDRKTLPSYLHPASEHREGFKAVLTQQWFEWFVCTVGLCLLVTIQSFLMLTGYQFFRCQGSTYIHYSWLLALRLNVCQLMRATITFWRHVLYTCRDYALVSALWTEAAEPFSF